MILLLVLLLFILPSLSFSQENIHLLPERAFDRYIIYQTLLVIWVLIGALVVILYMKLKEAKRVHDLNLEKEEEKVPFLD